MARDDWAENRMFIKETLEEHTALLRDIQKQVSNLRVKVALWSAAIGVVLKLIWPGH